MIRQKTFQIIIFLVVFAGGSAMVACANSERGGRGRMQGPPPEAIEACSGKAEGDTVSFTGRRGESLNATCQMVEDQLVAVPEGHNQRNQ